MKIVISILIILLSFVFSKTNLKKSNSQLAKALEEYDPLKLKSLSEPFKSDNLFNDLRKVPGYSISN